MKSKLFLAISLVLLSCLALKIFPKATVQTALDEYVYNDDDKSVVKYELVQMTKQNNCTTYTLKATTLKWLDGEHSNQAVSV